MRAKNKKVRFAVVGCGTISEVHLSGIMQVEEAELAAVCDVNEALADQKAQAYGVPAYYDYADLLAQPDIDAICLCTPNGFHYKQTMLAAEAGKHVICEKPLALTIADADRMVRACRQNRVLLSVVFPRRMAPASRFAKQLIDSGKLGKLSLCSGYARFYRRQDYYDRAGWRGTWDAGGGALITQAIHTIDLLQWLAGPVRSVKGYASHVLRDIEVEDTAVAALRFHNGALGVIEATTTAYRQPDHQIIIHGDLGTITLEGDEIAKLDIDGETVPIPAFEPFRVIPDGHRLQFRDMAMSILEGREPFIIGEDGRHSLEIILGIYASQRSDQDVNLAQLERSM